MTFFATPLVALAMMAGQAGSQAGGDAAAVRAFVESFLTRLGDHQFATLDADFAPKALIVVSRLKDGRGEGAPGVINEWANTYQTADEWLAALKRNPNPTTFREPITNVVVTIDSDRLAYLRADFQVVRDGRVVSSGVDQFTLIREAGGWKIAMVAYTSLPSKD